MKGEPAEYFKIKCSSMQLRPKSMSYCSIIALREVMLCCRKYLMGSHVLVECMSLGLTGVLVLHEGISYRMICCTGGHLLYEDTSYMRINLTG